MSSFSGNIWDELVSEFPPLWNPQDLHFRDRSMRAKCLQQLLEKCQSMSTVPVTLDTLKRKLSGVLKRRKRETTGIQTSINPLPITQSPAAKQRWTNRMEDLAAEFPCLWDTTDLNYSDREIKDRCRQQLLAKYNNLASVPITAASLNNKLIALRKRLARFQKKQEAAGRSGEESRDELSDLDTSSDSTSNAPVSDQIRWVVQDPTQLIPGILTLVFHCCCFCGEVKNDCTNVTDKPYVTDKTIPWLRPGKTALTLNELTVNLDFDKEMTPKTVCQSCDTKMKEVYNFIKLVKKAQDKMNPAEAIEIDDDDDDKKNYDITVTDTEIVNTNKRKISDAEKKTCSVTIDLNPSPDDDISISKMVDIETKYKMFKRDNVTAAATVTSTKPDKHVASDVSRDIPDTDDNVIVNVKKEIEPDGNQTNDMGINHPNAQDKSNTVVCTLNNENSTINNKIATISNIVSLGTLSTVHGEKEDVASSSVVSESTSKNEVCVIPKGELIQLVESIVSRMLNK